MSRFIKLVHECGKEETPAVRNAYRQIMKDFPDTTGADEATWYYADYQFGSGRLEQAQKLFELLLRSDRESYFVNRTVLDLAYLAQKRGDERAMVGYLEQAGRPRVTATGRRVNADPDSQQQALRQLGHHYFEKGDFKKSLDHFTRWQPKSWCRNCQASLDFERYRQMTLCRLHLGEHAGVVREILRDLAQDQGIGQFDAWMLWRVYAGADQLGDLRRMFDTYEAAWNKQPRKEEAERPDIQPLRDLFRLQALADKKDVAALVEICQQQHRRGSVRAYEDAHGDLLRSAAAEVLAGFGGPEVEPIVEALGKAPAERAWLIYALGRSSAATSLEALQKAAATTASGDLTDNIAYALALKGEPGKKVLQRLAEEKSEMGDAARGRLERKTEPAWPAPNWPRPKAGSLPTSLPK